MKLKLQMLNQLETKKACPHMELWSCSYRGTAVRSCHVFRVII